MTFLRRPRSSIESSPRQIISFLDGAIPPRLYGPNSQRPVSLAFRPRPGRPIPFSLAIPFSPERADHVAGPPTSRPLQDRIPHRARTNGGDHGCRPRDRGGAVRGAGLIALRHDFGGEGA